MLFEMRFIFGVGLMGHVRGVWLTFIWRWRYISSIFV